MAHPVSKRVNVIYQSVADWPTVRLHELLGSDGIQHVSHDLTRCVFLMELMFRTFGENPDVPRLVWQLVFGDVLPSPEGLMCPSQAHPHRRRRTEH
jgi:hypothetical protein